MPFEVESFFRILGAVVLGGVIGYEREHQNRPAGLRTHILVCLGAALVMIISEHIFNKYAGVTDLDPARLGAQVISGIGFLGAGTIIRDKFKVRGLTTAASLWVVASVGLGIGAGYYIITFLTTGIIFLTLSLMGRFEGKIGLKTTNAKITIIVDDDIETQVSVTEIIEEMGGKITSINTRRNRDNNTIILKYMVTCSKQSKFTEISKELSKKRSIINLNIDF